MRQRQGGLNEARTKREDIFISVDFFRFSSKETEQNDLYDGHVPNTIDNCLRRTQSRLSFTNYEIESDVKGAWGVVAQTQSSDSKNINIIESGSKTHQHDNVQTKSTEPIKQISL